MSGSAAPEWNDRARLTAAMLALFVGLTMVIASFLPAGAADQGRVTVAAMPGATVSPDHSIAGSMSWASPHNAGAWQAHLQVRRESRETPQRSEPSSGEPVEVREYLLRSAAAAHRVRWGGEATTPDFS